MQGLKEAGIDLESPLGEKQKIWKGFWNGELVAVKFNENMKELLQEVKLMR